MQLVVSGLLNLETCGDTVALKAVTGMATSSRGLKAKALRFLEQCEHNVESTCSACHRAKLGEEVSLEDMGTCEGGL